MGLKLIPDNDSIFLYEKGDVDAWGINSAGDSKKELGCLISGVETSTAIESKGGKMVIPSHEILFNFSVEISVGDFIEVEGRKMVVLSKQEKKDLSRKILITKITV